MNAHEKIKVAVLIDADTAQPAIVDGLLSELAKYGTASVKRICGDRTPPGLKGWMRKNHTGQPFDMSKKI